MFHLLIRILLSAAIGITIGYQVAHIWLDDEYLSIEIEEQIESTDGLIALINSQLNSVTQSQQKKFIGELGNHLGWQTELHKYGFLDTAHGEFHPIRENELWFFETEDNHALIYRYSPSHLISFRKHENRQMHQRFDSLDEKRLLIISSFVLLSLLIVFWPIQQQLTELSKTTRQLGKGDFSQSANEKAPQPIGLIAKSINKMSSDLISYMDEQKLVSDGLAHELRTPISRLRFTLDLLKQRQLEEQLGVMLVDIDQDIEELEQLASRFLTYSKLSSSRKLENITQVNLVTMISDILRKHRITDKDFSYSEIEKEDKIVGNEFYIYMAISNIVGNANKFCRSQVKVNLTKENRNIVISIEDDGDGIPSDQYRKVVKPFYTKAKPDSESQSFGLGLSIADKIMEKHQGKLNIGRSQLGGAKIELAFIIG